MPLTQRHGFIFDVPKYGQSDRTPITSAGRFAHESVAFDPNDGVLYLTEDNFGFPSGFYRYLPPRDPRKSRPAARRRPAADAQGARTAHTLFVNIQASRGMTFAIWGPWQQLGV